MVIQTLRLGLLAAFLVGIASGFQVTSPLPRQCRRTNLAAVAAAKATLNEGTTWRLRFFLQGLPTEKGRKVNEVFTVEAQFSELEGYEPPQGNLVQKPTDDDKTSRLSIVNSRWQLSEDPSERKDGLWVWGLFQEPLYPFLLLQVETASIPLPGEEGDAIKPLKLFCQLNHQRDKEKGAILTGGDLTIREMETIKADPFGAATVEIYDSVSVGKLSIEPKTS